MKTRFNIAWVDDNFDDPEMNLVPHLDRKLKRKNGFSLYADDVYNEVTRGDFDALLTSLASTIDLTNSLDLIVIDYQLGGGNTGEKVAKKFREKLPSADILFYSGKVNAEELRRLIASENVDGVNCVGRQDLVEGTYSVIENVINRSHKISTLRGLILNSVCEMDHMIIEILCKYSSDSPENDKEIKRKAVKLIAPKRQELQGRLERKPVEELLKDKNMMSGKLFSIFEMIKRKLGLSPQQLSLLGVYRPAILDLRTSAAHAKEATCETSGQSMLKFNEVEYKRRDIDGICKTIVSHENNIQSILGGMA
jgi:hypothetical protein